VRADRLDLGGQGGTLSHRWHRYSEFGQGPRVPLDREHRARFRFLLDAHKRGGRLTADYVEVGRALLRCLGQDGRLDPSHAFLAGCANCEASTVRRALKRMQGLGLVQWVRRLARDARSGWRCEQISNAYSLHPACDVQRARAIRGVLLKKEAQGQERRTLEAVLPGLEAAGGLERDRRADLRVLEAVAIRRRATLGLA
jgi:hypothetical protein